MKIKCKDKAELIKYQIKDEISKLDKAPKFVIVQVGDNDASNRYVKWKIRDCEFVGIEVNLLKLPEDITEEMLIDHIVDKQSNCDAIIVQLPLPKHINAENVMRYISPWKDVDGLSENSVFEPCTPLGVMCILEEILDLDLEGKDVVILGRSKLVGLPLAHMLQKKNATVSLCHSKTSSYSRVRLLKGAHVVISAVGKYMKDILPELNPNAYIIDVGINVDADGSLVGDIPDDFRWHKTPVPGGVGLMTRVMLLKNILEAYKINHSIKEIINKTNTIERGC